MGITFMVVLEAVTLASALSMDAFVAGFAYGSTNIRIPMLSIQIINIICSTILGISLLTGALLKRFIPGRLTLLLCFVILLVLGVVKLLDSIIKAVIRKYNDFNKEIAFSAFNIKFILNLYANPEEADIDSSRTISSSEAASLAIALSLDGLAVGFGAMLGNVNAPAVFAASLFTNAAAIMLGCYAGSKIALKTPFDLSWLSGVLLIFLAFLKYYNC